MLTTPHSHKPPFHLYPSISAAEIIYPKENGLDRKPSTSLPSSSNLNYHGPNFPFLPVTEEELSVLLFQATPGPPPSINIFRYSPPPPPQKKASPNPAPFSHSQPHEPYFLTLPSLPQTVPWHLSLLLTQMPSTEVSGDKTTESVVHSSHLTSW